MNSRDLAALILVAAASACGGSVVAAGPDLKEHADASPHDGGSPPCAVVVPDHFDKSCTVNEDCRPVMGGGDLCQDVCNDPWEYFCIEDTLNVAAKAQYDDAITAALGHSVRDYLSRCPGGHGNTYSCNDAGTPECVKGKCTMVFKP